MRELRVPDLPADAQERRALLNRDFSSLLVVDARHRDDGWCLEILRPDTLDVFVDPQIAEGLRLFGGVAPEAVGDFVREEQGFQLSLEDSWTAHAFSSWLARAGPRPRAVILHADDHTDFDSPHLAYGTEGLIDLLAGDAVDLAKPSTVAAAVSSGAIGVAGFFAPFLPLFDELEIRHLRRTVPSDSEGWRALLPLTKPDIICRPGVPRPALHLGDKGTGNGAPLRYVATSDPDEWARGLPDLPVLFHFDLDYLSNRFNGDSDWNAVPDRHDPSTKEVARMLRSMFDALEQNTDAAQVEAAAVAVSPGFFPAEHWQPTLGSIRRRLPSLTSHRQSG